MLLLLSPIVLDMKGKEKKRRRGTARIAVLKLGSRGRVHPFCNTVSGSGN
jgi:hypothetical protein